MDVPAPLEIALLALLVFLASSVGTITTFGTSTIRVPVLALLYPFSAVLLFTGVIHGANTSGRWASSSKASAGDSSCS